MVEMSCCTLLAHMELAAKIFIGYVKRVLFAAGRLFSRRFAMQREYVV